MIKTLATVKRKRQEQEELERLSFDISTLTKIVRSDGAFSLSLLLLEDWFTNE